MNKFELHKYNHYINTKLKIPYLFFFPELTDKYYNKQNWKWNSTPHTIIPVLYVLPSLENSCMKCVVTKKPPLSEWSFKCVIRLPFIVFIFFLLVVGNLVPILVVLYPTLTRTIVRSFFVCPLVSRVFGKVRGKERFLTKP